MQTQEMRSEMRSNVLALVVIPKMFFTQHKSLGNASWTHGWVCLGGYMTLLERWHGGLT